MREIFKIILICLIIAFGLLCLFISSRVIYYVIIDYRQGYYGWGKSILFPISISLLFIPSIIFNIKTIYLNKSKNRLKNYSLEFAKQIDEGIKLDLSEIKSFLWISNFLFGIITLIFGVCFLYMIYYDCGGCFEDLLLLSIFTLISIIGISVIIDEIFLSRVLLKQLNEIIKKNEESI